MLVVGQPHFSAGQFAKFHASLQQIIHVPNMQYLSPLTTTDRSSVFLPIKLAIFQLSSIFSIFLEYQSCISQRNRVCV